MQTASWSEIEGDLKLGVFLITVAAQSLLPDYHPAAGPFGKAALGDAFNEGQLATWQVNDDEDLQSFNVSNTRFYLVARACYDYVHATTPLDSVDIEYFEAEHLHWLHYFLHAVPHDEYVTHMGGSSVVFMERRDKGDEYPVPGLHLSAAAKANLAKYLQEFPHSLGGDIGFAPFEIAALAGMNIASVRNFVGPDGGKPIRTIPGEKGRFVYGNSLDTLEWLAGRRKFDAGPLSPQWVVDAGGRSKSLGDACAIIGIYAWVNRVTTEMLAERSGLPAELIRRWTRGEVDSIEPAKPLARAVGLDPELYHDIVARQFGADPKP